MQTIFAKNVLNHFITNALSLHEKYGSDSMFHHILRMATASFIKCHKMTAEKVTHFNSKQRSFADQKVDAVERQTVTLFAPDSVTRLNDESCVFCTRW